MRGSRPFDHTDWKSKKRSSRPQMSCFYQKYWYSEEQKKVYTSSDVLFSSESVGEEKKNVFIVRDGAPIFSEALGFSLLSLYAEMGIHRDNLSAIVIGDNFLSIIVIAQNSFDLLITVIAIAIYFVIADKLLR